MKIQSNTWSGQTELTRLDRLVLHLRCLIHDHKYRWHLAGIWREVALR